MSRFRPHASILAALALSTPAAAQCWEPTFGGEPGAFGTDVLAEYDDGTGMALYAGGNFLAAGGNEARHIARWDGTEWSDVGGGTNDHVHALAVFDDGAGPVLYAAGHFTVAGGIAASNIARWDGTAWSEVGGGTNGEITSLAVYDDGSGPALYVGGYFSAAGAVAASRLARWDGANWSSVGGGTNSTVWALIVHDAGGGPELYVAGAFTLAGGQAANRIAPRPPRLAIRRRRRSVGILPGRCWRHAVIALRRRPAVSPPAGRLGESNQIEVTCSVWGSLASTIVRPPGGARWDRGPSVSPCPSTTSLQAP